MKCIKNYNAHAQPLFCSLNILFGDILIATAVVFSVRSLMLEVALQWTSIPPRGK